MARKLASTVHVRDPQTGSIVALAAGTELPDWAADQVTNPAAFSTAGVPGAAAATGDFNPDAPVADLLAYVGDDATRARAVLDTERAKGDAARKTLVERLEATAGTSG